ncbi:MAG: S-ribosylhomocysteine lyase [Oscillospiraceae bacterium]
MERIASFTVDHTVLVPGLYLSRRDGTTVTFDLRFKKPNTGDLLSNAELHSVEHVIATLLRNSPQKDAVIYFGPMGCQTGFYFLFDGEKLSNANAVRLLQRVFTAAAKFDGAMPGASARECGNYRNLDVELARRCCAYYADVIADWSEEKLVYPEK